MNGRVAAFMNIMRREAQRVVDQPADLSYGIVRSFDPNTYTATVMIQPENTGPTGFLPIASDWVGNGWGMFCPPSEGDVVMVEFQDGDLNSGIITRRQFGNVLRPLKVNSGEYWLVHQSGCAFKLTNDGKGSWNSTAEIDIGNLAQTVRQLVTEAFVALFNGHTHNGSPPPDQQMGAAHLTNILKAN